MPAKKPPGPPKTYEPNAGGNLDGASLEDLVREMLVRLGQDPTREGLSKTPARDDKSLT